MIRFISTLFLLFFALEVCAETNVVQDFSVPDRFWEEQQSLRQQVSTLASNQVAAAQQFRASADEAQLGLAGLKDRLQRVDLRIKDLQEEDSQDDARLSAHAAMLQRQVYLVYAGLGLLLLLVVALLIALGVLVKRMSLLLAVNLKSEKEIERLTEKAADYSAELKSLLSARVVTGVGGSESTEQDPSVPGSRLQESVTDEDWHADFHRFMDAEEPRD